MRNRALSFPFFPRIPVLVPLALAALVTLSGCGGVVIGAGASAATAAAQERGLEAALVDTRIQTELNHSWLQYDKELFPSLASSVYERRVLLTGVVPNQKVRDDIIALAWKVTGVREVINEIVIDASGSSGTFARDSWISAQVKSKVLFDKKIISINYQLETVRHVVYLMGVAQDKAELDRVINYARNVEYVERVVNHVLLKNDPRRRS